MHRFYKRRRHCPAPAVFVQLSPDRCNGGDKLPFFHLDKLLR